MRTGESENAIKQNVPHDIKIVPEYACGACRKLLSEATLFPTGDENFNGVENNILKCIGNYQTICTKCTKYAR